MQLKSNLHNRRFGHFLPKTPVDTNHTRLLYFSRRMLAEILKKTGFYSERDVRLFEDAIRFRAVAKDEILLAQGNVCKSVFYVVKGAFYQYDFRDEIEQNVIDLHTDGEWFLNHKSFVSQKPSASFVQAYAESEIMELTIESLHRLIAESPAFLQMGRILEQATARVHFFDNALTPTQKYEYLLDNRPQLLQAFPLKIIASYLKITPETLSRVREKLARGKIVS